MDAIKKAVLACVRECGPNDELEADLGRIIAHHGDPACKVVLEVLTHLNFETPAAVHHWQQILGHQTALREALERPVPLAVAICDYFQWVKKYTGCAKLVDIHRFEEIFYRNQHDSLTGLHNREAFDEALAQELAHAKRHGRPFSLLFMDIDSFKQVNDTHGHQVGDRVLRAVGAMLLSCKRAADLAARYGGDEFLLLLPDTDKEEALVLAERIRARVAGQALEADQPLRIRLSCGAATFPDDGGDDAALKKYADDALYRSKRGAMPGPATHILTELKVTERPCRPRLDRPHQPCLAILCPAGRG
jgi:diguanylate cyclase (GGDEF)-like protein